MAEYDFGLRATGVEELRAQLRALRSDGTQAFGDLEAAGSRGLQRLDAAQRDHGAVVERSAASYSVLAERVRSLDSASGRSLPALTETGRAFGEIEVSAGRGGAALSAYATTVGALDHTMSTFAVSVEKTIGHVAGVAQTAVDGVVSLGQTAMAAIGGVIGVLEIGSIIDNLSRLRAATMGETDALEAMGDSADEAGVSLTGLAAHWVAYRAAAAGAEAVGLPYLGTMVAILGRANVYIGTAVALASGLTAAARATDALTEAQAGLDKELERTHYRSGQTTQRIMELARAEEDRTGRSQQQIAAAAQALLAYDGVSGPVFDRAVRVSADLAQKYGIDLTKAAAELGQALQDPTRGLDGLTERGVAFSFATREAIKAATDLGDTMRASGLVLDTVEQQAGGAAAGIDEAARASARLDAEIRRFLEVVGPYAVKLREIKDAVVKLFTEPSTWLENKAADVVGWINRQVDPGPLSERITEVGAKLAQLKQADAEATQRGGLTDRVWSQQRKKEIEDYQARYNALLDQARQLEIADQKAAEGLAAGERERRSRGMKDVGAAIAQGLGALPQGIEGRVKAINTEMDGLIDKLEALRAPDGSNGAEIDKEIARVEMLRESKLQQAKASEASKAAGSEETDEREAAVEAIDNIIDRLVRERDAINLSERAKYVNNAALEAERAARDRLNEGELAEYIRQVQYEAGVTYDAVAAKKAKVKADEDQARAAEQAARDLARVSENVSKDVSTMIWDGMTGKAKSEDAFKYIMNWVKRLGVELLSQNIILPITMQVVGAVPQLFGLSGGSSVAGGGAGIAAGGGGVTSSLTGTATNWGISKALGWAGDKLGLTGGLDTLMATPLSGGVGAAYVAPTVTLADGTVVAASPAVQASQQAMLATSNGGFTLGGALGAAGAGAFGGMFGGMLGTATNSKVVGGLSGAALGAGASALSAYLGLGAMGGPIGLAIGAVVGGIMGMIGTQKATVGPNSSGNVTLNGKGGFRTDTALADNGADAGQMQTVTDTVAKAMNTLVTAVGGKVTGGDGLNTGLLQFFAKDNKWYVTPQQGENAGKRAEFGSQEDAIQYYMRESLKGLLSTGQLTGINDDVKKALSTSKATKAEDLATDLGFAAEFRRTFDAMNAALDPTNNQLKTFAENAKTLGQQVATNITDWKTKAAELGLATDGELTKAARSGIEAMLGLGNASAPLSGLAAVTKQAEINIEAVKPALSALGYTAAEQADIIARYTKKLQDDYTASVQYVQRQGAATIEALVDSTVKTSALDRLQGMGLDRTSKAVGQLATAIEGVEGKARQGALTIDDERTARALLDRALMDGVLTAQQYSQAVGLLTQAWSDSAAAAQKAAEKAAYAANISSRTYAALGLDRSAQLISLDQQQAQELATAKAAGRDTTALSQIQLAERQRMAFDLAKADLLAGYDQQIAKLQDMATALQNGAVAAEQAARQFRDAYDKLALSDASPLAPGAKLAEIARQWDEAYATAKSATASKEEREAARQKLLSLGDSYVAADRAVNATSSTAAWDKVRGVFAEFGNVQSEARDTASKQLDAINDQITELQRQRADANRMGEKQYGALSGLKSVADQSYAIWQAALAPLQRLTGTTPGTSPSTTVNPSRYAASAAVQADWDSLSAGQQTAVIRGIGWQGGIDESLNIWLATTAGKSGSFESGVTSAAEKKRRLLAFTNADIEAAFGGMSDIQAARAADPSFNLAAWFQRFGIDEVLSGARRIPGFVAGGVVGNGLWNVDSVLTWLAGGEHVTRAPAVNGETLPVLDWINRTGRVPADLGGRSAGRDEAAGEVRSLHRTVDGLARTVDRMAGAIVALAEEQLSELTGIRSATERRGFSV